MSNESGTQALPLDVLQRWMLRVMTDPGGVAAGIESADAQREIEVAQDRLASVICPSIAQTSLERLAVYSNAYHARLLEVLVGEYPALVCALGEDAFALLGAGYLQQHPSSSYTLADLAGRFPEYLSRTRPPKHDGDLEPDWADFLIELAVLERTYSEVFDGRGIEVSGALAIESLQNLSPEQWLSTRLVPAPCLRLLTFRFPVHEYASAVRRGDQPSPPGVQRT